MAIVAPLLAWGTPAVISGWTDFNTPVVTGAQADPFGGTAAYLMEDNSASLTEGKSLTITLTKNGTVVVSVFAKAGSATGFGVGWFDNTASVYRGYADYTWSGGTFATVGGSVTTYTPILVGASWYLFRFAFAGALAANTNLLQIFPTKTTASLQGTTSFYVRNVALVPVIDNALYYTEDAEGTEHVQGRSGVEDAWVVGPDFLLEADIRHIPNRDENTPSNATGFDGQNEAAGVNAGWNAAIQAGRNKTDLLWVPDRTDCTTYTTSYLAEPMRGGVTLEEGAANYRRVRITLRNRVSEYVGWVA